LTEAARQASARHVELLNGLFASLQSRAFSGQL
jgi:hypothetical protein